MEQRLYNILTTAEFNKLVRENMSYHSFDPTYDVECEEQLGTYTSGWTTISDVIPGGPCVSDVLEYVKGNHCDWMTLLSFLALHKIIPEGWYLLIKE